MKHDVSVIPTVVWLWQ